MTDFFRNAKEMMHKKGFEEIYFKDLFLDLRGIIVLDTLDNYSELIEEINTLDTGLNILETRKVGCENVKEVIQEAIEKNKKIKRISNRIKL